MERLLYVCQHPVPAALLDRHRAVAERDRLSRRLCPWCTRQRQDRYRAAARAGLEDLVQPHRLPELRGPEREVEHAVRLRRRVLAGVEEDQGATLAIHRLLVHGHQDGTWTYAINDPYAPNDGVLTLEQARERLAPELSATTSAWWIGTYL